MEPTPKLTKREAQVLELLLQGKSNKQIAQALGITASTVEFHLKNIYLKYGVSSYKELAASLGKSTGETALKPGDSTVAPPTEMAHNQDQVAQPTPADSSESAHKKGRSQLLRGIVPLIILAASLAYLWLRPASWDGYTRECERPDEATVGQTLTRSNASGGEVHGQFGATGAPPYPAQEGQVVYREIPTPRLEHAYLKLRYSKDSPASVPILVFVDDETRPRGSLSLVDQHSWEGFAWSEPLDLGELGRGVHAIKLYTVGQPYGVADLDQLVLISTLP
jgi:DNA-binding CsgD family transcriptional regulator